MAKATVKLAPAVLVAFVLVMSQALPAWAKAGAPDKTFSGDGVAVVNFTSGNDYGQNLAIQKDGKIVAIGWNSGGLPTNDVFVARFLSNGHLDKTFSGDGKARIDFAGGGDSVGAVAMTPNGKIVVVGGSSQASNENFLIARLNPNGTLDKTFSGDGKLLLDNDQYDYANDVVVQPNGEIVFAGRSGPQSTPYGVVGRLKVGGHLDKGFATNGYQSTDFGGTGQGVIYAMDVRPNGKIVVTGSAGPSPRDIGLAQFLPNGAPDLTFGGGTGITTTSFGSRSADGYDMALFGKRLVVASSLGGPPGNDILLLRYTAKGNPDNTFGSGGHVITDLGGYEDAHGVAVADDGRIVVTGSYFKNSALGILVMRYRVGGHRDAMFGNNGAVKPQNTYDNEPKVALQKDGRIVVVDAAGAGERLWVGRFRAA